MPAPRTRRLAGWTISLVRPSGRPSVSARPEAAQGIAWTSCSIPRAHASVSVRPVHEISGSVYATDGMERASKAAGKAGGRLGGHRTLVRRLVREHGLPDHVADGGDVLDVRAHPLVDGDHAARADLDAGRRGADPIAVRPPADGDKDAVDHLRRGRGVALVAHAQAVVGGLDARDTHTEVDRLVARRDPPLERPHEIPVTARDEPVAQLHHRHAGAERVVHRRHLEPDDAAAHDEQALGDLLERERASSSP